MKSKISALLFLLIIPVTSIFAHKAELFIHEPCVNPGGVVRVEATITNTNNRTWYNWMYRDQSGEWKCFVNGENVINGTTFEVSGANKDGGDPIDQATVLEISNATSALDNVDIRIYMRDDASPCGAPAGTVYGGDDLNAFEAKTLRLRVYSPDNCQNCSGNLLVDGEGRNYGGMEAVEYDAANSTYIDHNFEQAQTDYTYRPYSTDPNRQPIQNGEYMVINNPKMANNDYQTFPPHSGNNMLIVNGGNDGDAAWKKTWPVAVDEKCTMTVKFSVANVDGANSQLRLLINGNEELTLNPGAIGDWKEFTADVAIDTTDGNDLTMEIVSSGAAKGVFALDDICLVINCKPLPVRLNKLDLHEEGKSVVVSWSTTEEVNADRFEVQHSLEGKSWNTIGTVAAVGNSSVENRYSFTDPLPMMGQNLYRLRMIDKDETFEFSQIRSILVKEGERTSLAYPVPAVDKLQIKNSVEVTNLELVNLEGRKVIQLGKVPSNGIDVSRLPAGLYILKTTDREGRSASQKVLVDH